MKEFGQEQEKTNKRMAEARLVRSGVYEQERDIFRCPVDIEQRDPVRFVSDFGQPS